VNIDCERIETLPVPVLDRIGLFTEKLLANSDRHADRSVFARDLIDLLMMVKSWGAIPQPAWDKARSAYGDTVAKEFHRAVQALRDAPAYLDECFATLGVDGPNQQAIQKQLAAV